MIIFLVLGPDSKKIQKMAGKEYYAGILVFYVSYNEINVRKINNYLFLKKIKITNVMNILKNDR